MFLIISSGRFVALDAAFGISGTDRHFWPVAQGVRVSKQTKTQLENESCSLFATFQGII
jgi:hypothetical protein